MRFLYILAEIAMLVLYAVVFKYPTGGEDIQQSAIDSIKEIQETYAMWIDIHTMIFVGFGFLMVFLKTHCWASVGFNYLIAAWTVQCGILFVAVAHELIGEGGSLSHRIDLKYGLLVEGDFCAAAALITMGALLGKTTYAQLFVLVTFESIVYALNAVIVLKLLGCHDVGGALTIHMFGAYYGLAATYFFENKKAIEDAEQRNKGNYMSQTVALIGTIFLFIYWPSFNAILATGISKDWAIINTLLSITSSALVACFVAHAKLGKFDMEVLLNSTLAGGVIMGAAADIIASSPGFVMLAGAIAGAISAAGYLWLNDLFKSKLSLHDTCGVHFLHAIPGVLGGLTAVFALLHAETVFSIKEKQELFPWSQGSEARSFKFQALMNLIGMGVTIVIAVFSGSFFGYVVQQLPMPKAQFDDTKHFVHVEFGDDTTKYNKQHE